MMKSLKLQFFWKKFKIKSYVLSKILQIFELIWFFQTQWVASTQHNTARMLKRCKCLPIKKRLLLVIKNLEAFLYFWKWIVQMGAKMSDFRLYLMNECSKFIDSFFLTGQRPRWPSQARSSLWPEKIFCESPSFFLEFLELYSS
jgi:hypothetical protein